MTSERPVFLDLRRIQLPIGGWVSLLHRLAGIVLAVAVVPLALLLTQALSGPAGFATSAAVLAHPLTKLGLLILFWAFLHHLLAGVRHLLLDLGWGLALRRARHSAWASLGGAVLGAVLWAGAVL